MHCYRNYIFTLEENNLIHIFQREYESADKEDGASARPRSEPLQSDILSYKGYMLYYTGLNDIRSSENSVEQLNRALQKIVESYDMEKILAEIILFGYFETEIEQISLPSSPINDEEDLDEAVLLEQTELVNPSMVDLMLKNSPLLTYLPEQQQTGKASQNNQVVDALADNDGSSSFVLV